MYGCVILYVCVVSDRDFTFIAAQCCVEPDCAVVSQSYISNNAGPSRHHEIGFEARRLSRKRHYRGFRTQQTT